LPLIEGITFSPAYCSLAPGRARIGISGRAVPTPYYNERMSPISESRTACRHVEIDQKG
jgi:hypothetical protein